MIEGQLWAASDAPVPIVYESPRARYRTESALDVSQRAPDVDFGADPADHLVGELGG
jgi:hypothetical protein